MGCGCRGEAEKLCSPYGNPIYPCKYLVDLAQDFEFGLFFPNQIFSFKYLLIWGYTIKMEVLIY